MKIVSLCGLLGYGYSEESLEAAFAEKVDYVGVDAGSTDPGPYYLGSGKSFTDRGAVKRDLSLALPKALVQKAPFIIGTAGGAGSRAHTDWLLDILREIAAEQKLSFRMGVIYSDVDRDYVLQKLHEGKIIPMSETFPLTEEAVNASTRIVSQIGVAPFLRLLDEGVDVIVSGRACDTAIYAAPCIHEGYPEGLAFHMAKIMECGAMCCEPVAAADVMQGYMYKDHFELEPASPNRKCLAARAAAHTMYEQGNPYLIFEPDGVIDLKNASFEQMTERRVRISGAEFRPAEQKTLKLEGVRKAGCRTICVGGINDPLTISRFPEIEKTVQDFVRKNAKLDPSDFSLRFRTYGGPESSFGVVIDTVGATQQIADTICSLARSRLLHCDYDGRKSSAGNVAFPFSPSDVHVGDVFTFSIYHLAVVDDLAETAVSHIEEVRS
ncbi:MAG: acyclic terpene utilization AtuA family protein [Oscillospiraceae bacterium]|nr:acyclic terpene utilization AtuA family protein [Oscillospiraceae bacterium]